jgi:hypothetical protein
MTNCADADVRRELDSLIVDFYHKTLIERCHQLGKKSRFSLKAVCCFKEIYKKQK